ncbi:MULTISPECIES: phospholipase domain-containing protein [Chryseobacterium]|uniref:phospholipase domain-containing protein n=1 Tax=Chryseobacterium TaxID=59732 RepID=UPI000C9DADDD|nr:MULTISPECIES: phospholipase domain-containing protein [Chryseobacterium]VXA93123.1 Phospholipase C [Chryseobacterium sp. 8AT]
MKPPTLLQYNYDVNLKNNKIVMTNLKATAVPLIIYDKNKFNTKDYYFSFELNSNDEVSHQVDVKSYSYEVIGPNGFGRKFKGSKNPELEVTLLCNLHKNEVDVILTNISANTLNVSFKNQYDGNKKDFNLNATSREKISISLDKTKGWYDLKIKSNSNSWHFVGRIESGKPIIN